MDFTEIGLNETQLAAVQKMIQSETDKVRTDYSQRLKASEEELAKYKPIEKSDAEKELEARLKALEDKERDVNAKERQNQIVAKLKEKGLPEELSSILNIGENIDEDIEKVGATLGNYFLNESYKPESHANSKGITKQQFKRMSYSERAKLFEENPELYKSLSK